MKPTNTNNSVGSALKGALVTMTKGTFGSSDDNVGLSDKMQQKVDDLHDKKLASWTQQQYQKCKQDREGITRQWYINLAFYKGDQYVDVIRGNLIKLPAMPNKVRMVINKIRPAMRTQVSRMTSQKPSATVVPASSEDDDLLAAEAGESVWEHLSETQEYQKHMINACWWASNTGVGYIKTEWDKSYEDKDADNGQGALGKIKYSSPSPFHIHVPNLLERDIEDQPFVLHTFTMTLEEAKYRFPDKIDDEKKPTVVGTNEIMESKYLNLRGGDNNAQPDSVLVIEAWVKPNQIALMPKGGLLIVVDDILVYKSEDGIPHEHGEYPFAKIDEVLSGGYYSTSVIEDLIPLQREYNSNRSLTVEARKLTAKPGYFVQEGSVDMSKWRSVSGQLIPVKPGFQNPVPMTLPQIPSYVAAELQTIDKDFEDISGQHQVSKGTAPSGVTAATAISFLQEQDQSFMSPTYTSIEMATQKVAKQSLVLAVQYWDEPRLIKAAGSDQAMSVRFLSRSDIKNGTDIRIEGGSSLPVSKAARTALFMDLISKGILPADKGLELLNLPNMRSYYAIIKVDENHATRENLKLRTVDPALVQQAREQVAQQKQQMLMQVSEMQGMEITEEMAMQDPILAQALNELDAPMLPVNDFDNDEVHIFVHERYMKSQGYEMLDPAIQDEFKKHVEAHKSKQQMQQLTQLMQGGTNEMAMPGQGMAGQEALPGMEGAPPVGGQDSSSGNQFSGIEGQGAPVDAGMGQ